MPEPFALTCDCCAEPMLPNLSQADADGCLWICINPDCPELCAGVFVNPIVDHRDSPIVDRL
jgi:hypothetical protein